VIPPDESVANEYATGVNNSIYTNAIAAQTLRFALEIAPLLNGTPPQNWATVAAGLEASIDTLLFNATLQTHLEYEGFPLNGSVLVNQADVALLQYPLGMSFTGNVSQNDLLFYQNVTQPNGFFTGDNAYSIAWLRLQSVSEALQYYNSSFAHMQPPFYVWNERLKGGHPHFITGAGGFLQNYLFGFAGVRLSESALQLVNPTLPPEVDALTLRNVYFRNTTFSIRLTSSDLEVTQTSPAPIQGMYFLLQTEAGFSWGLGYGWSTLSVGAGSVNITVSSKPGPRPPTWAVLAVIFGSILVVLLVVTFFTLLLRSKRPTAEYEPINT